MKFGVLTTHFSWIGGVTHCVNGRREDVSAINLWRAKKSRNETF